MRFLRLLWIGYIYLKLKELNTCRSIWVILRGLCKPIHTLHSAFVRNPQSSLWNQWSYTTSPNSPNSNFRRDSWNEWWVPHLSSSILQKYQRVTDVYRALTMVYGWNDPMIILTVYKCSNALCLTAYYTTLAFVVVVVFIIINIIYSEYHLFNLD